MKKAILLLAVLTLLLAGCTPAAPEQNQQEGGEVVISVGQPVGATTNARAYYHIFVGSFSDSNNDGIGDLRGIINRFDYLNDGDDTSGKSLGVEGIWLSPIFASPSYHKYDTTDYYAIDPKFGTMEDLQELINLCHSRNVQIILDLVLNHTASRHSWFQEFKQARKDGNTQSPYYDYFTYVPEKTGTATYQVIAGDGGFYECNFSVNMPELNFDNPDVRQQMLDVAKYYLDMGVDGFRFDAAKYIYFGDEAGNVAFWDWYMAQLRAIKPDIYTVAEVWDSDFATYPYFSSTNCFNFTMSQVSGKIMEAARGTNVDNFVSYVGTYISNITEYRKDAMPVTFIANHDMDRAAGFLTVSGGQAFTGASLSLLMPGSSFIYYGEEIGMLGSRGGANTDANRRLAMLWGDGDTVKDPEGANYAAEQVNGTVADQLSQPNSLYNHYKNLIAIRKANPEIANGSYTPLKVKNSKAGGFVSTYEGKSVAVIHNTTHESVEIDISACTEIAFTQIAAVAGLAEAFLDGTVLTVGPQTSVVLR